MNIAFQCPQGHSLNAPSELAGRPGQCPKCGSKFVVPTNSEIAASGNVMAPQASSGSGKGPIQTSDPSRSLPPDRFLFLCPNGHKLNGPVSLRGKPGQCPKCQSKFLIPEKDETDELTPAEQSIHDAEKSTMATVPAQPPMTVEPEPEPEPEPESFDLAPPEVTDDEVPVTEVVDRWSLPPPAPGGSELPFAELFHWIWRQRDPRSTVVLHLKDGKDFTVRQFAPTLSRSGFGMFASTEQSGKHTLTAIAWDQISRLTVQGLSDYPQVYFQDGA